MPEQRHGPRRPARTVLEHLIRERQQTFDEFAEYAETFAREHGESGTLSVRHLQRLVAGRSTDGTPLGPPRPATARLLERIFGLSINELLAHRLPSGYVMPSVERTLGLPLQVAVAVVVNGSEVLLVCRREQGGAAVSWQFPAGVVKPGAQAEVVAVQETLAETGVHCRMTQKLGSRLHPITTVYCRYFLCEYVTGDVANLDVVENIDARWIDRGEIVRLVPVEQIYPPILRALSWPTCAHGS